MFTEHLQPRRYRIDATGTNETQSTPSCKSLTGRNKKINSKGVKEWPCVSPWEGNAAGEGKERTSDLE